MSARAQFRSTTTTKGGVIVLVSELNDWVLKNPKYAITIHFDHAFATNRADTPIWFYDYERCEGILITDFDFDPEVYKDILAQKVKKDERERYEQLKKQFEMSKGV